MSAVFLPPLRVEPTVVLSNAIDTAPAKRVLLDEPGLVARSAGNQLYFVFSTAGRAYDSIALIRTNLAATDTIRVRVGMTPEMEGTVYVDQTVQAWSGAAPVDKALTYVPLGQVYSAPYVRVDITTAAAFAEVSRILIGKRIEVDGVDRGAEFSYLSGSVVDDGPGWSSVEEARSRLSWKATAGNVSRVSYVSEWAPFLSRVGKHSAFLLVPQTDSDSIQVEAALVRHQDDAKPSDLTSNRYQIEMQLLEI